jgi:hypothetical protein
VVPRVAWRARLLQRHPRTEPHHQARTRTELAGLVNRLDTEAVRRIHRHLQHMRILLGHPLLTQRLRLAQHTMQVLPVDPVGIRRRVRPSLQVHLQRTHRTVLPCNHARHMLATLRRRHLVPARRSIRRHRVRLVEHSALPVLNIHRAPHSTVHHVEDDGV